MEDNDVDYCVLKIVLIGASGVGKTSLVNRFQYNEKPLNEHKTTLGVDFAIRKMEVNGKYVKCQVWDTAGQERFAEVTRNYFKNADAIFACFDPKKKETLEYVINQYLNSQQMDLAKPDAYRIFVATKSDLSPMKQLNSTEMLDQVEAVGIPLIWTSAMNNENVLDLFKGACVYCLENVSPSNKRDSETIVLDHNERLTNSCC